MGKSVEELRRILQRMQSDLEKAPSSRSEDSAVQEDERPEHYDSPPPSSVRPSLTRQPDPVEPQSQPPPAPAPAGWSAAEQTSPSEERPRWLDPSRRVFSMDSVGQRLVLWCAVLTSTAGLYFENMPLAGLGMLWLALRAFSIGFESSNELEDLAKRVAVLERRVSKVSARAAEEAGRDLDEDIQELKTLVKTLFKAISAEEENKEPEPEEKAEDD